MKEEPLVSIITPVYNAAKYIAETIESVIAQNYKNWELILVDDNSTDESVSVIRPYLKDDRVNLIELAENEGAAKARNTGIKAAKGELIAFIDADDIWKKDKLKKQIEFIRKKDIAFSFTSYDFGDENAHSAGKTVVAPEMLTYKKALSRTVIFTSTVMFNLGETKAGKRLAKEDIYMPQIASEDTATWWKILRSGYTAYGLDEVLTIYRRPAGGSLSSNKGTAIKRIWNLYKKNEGFGTIKSIRYFIPWAIRATLRRL